MLRLVSSSTISRYGISHIVFRMGVDLLLLAQLDGARLSDQCT
jgi:hypothetical protein